MATDVCLPVSRFSHAHGERSDNTIPWTHISAEDIFVIVTGDDPNVHGGSLNMKVVHRTTVLESVNISSYIDESLKVRTRALRSSERIQVEQLPIFGITKEHLLAIRYRRPRDMSRRLQLRMRSTTECQQIVNIFQRRGMDFQEPRSKPSATSTSMSQTKARSCQISRTTSASAELAPMLTDRIQTPLWSRISELGSNDSRQNTEVEMPPSDKGSLIPSNWSGMPPPQCFARDGFTAQLNTAQSSPQRLQRANTVGLRHCEIPVDPNLREESFRTMSGCENYMSSNVTGLQDLPSSLHNEYNKRSLSSYFEKSDRTSPPSALESRIAQKRIRPNTSSAVTEFSGVFEAEIPPRREIPFSRPESRKSDSVQSRSRPDTSSMFLWPPNTHLSAKETDISKLANSPSTRCSAAQIPQGNLLPKLTLEAQDSAGLFSLHNTSTVTGMNNFEFARPPSPRSIHMSPRLEISSAVQDPPSYGNAACMVPLQDRTPNIENNRQPEFNPEQSKLADYTKQNFEERMSRLNKFMIENLRNPDFIILCEDIEKCWRRIGIPLERR